MTESADIVELLARLTRAGYRVTFTSRYGSIMPDVDIIVEAVVGEPDFTLAGFPEYYRRFNFAPLILHPNGDGILKELERAANLLAPEAH